MKTAMGLGLVGWMMVSCGGTLDSESSTREEGGAGTGSSPSGGAGAPAGEACSGDLDEVRRAWGIDCPTSYCEAVSAASSCELFDGLWTQYRDLRVDWFTHALFIDWGTHTKTCIYEDDVLVGANAADDVPTYCNGTSSSIEAGERVELVLTDSTVATCAEGASNAVDDSGARLTRDAPLCFNAYSSTCAPCCPDPAPDCTDRPDGYPGYTCTLSSGSYCSCSCNGGEWSCAC